MLLFHVLRFSGWCGQYDDGGAAGCSCACGPLCGPLERATILGGRRDRKHWARPANLFPSLIIVIDSLNITLDALDVVGYCAMELLMMRKSFKRNMQRNLAQIAMFKCQ